MTAAAISTLIKSSPRAPSATCKHDSRAKPWGRRQLKQPEANDLVKGGRHCHFLTSVWVEHGDDLDHKPVRRHDLGYRFAVSTQDVHLLEQNIAGIRRRVNKDRETEQWREGRGLRVRYEEMK